MPSMSLPLLLICAMIHLTTTTAWLHGIILRHSSWPRLSSRSLPRVRRNLASSPTEPSASTTTTSSMTPVPRAAVSVVVRFTDHHSVAASALPPVYYLLIQRGNPPNEGVWCVPGGKIEWGEATLAAAQRELTEEVKFVGTSSNNDDSDNDTAKTDNDAVHLQWHEGAFCTSDSIVPSTDTSDGYHYVIAQCFAEVVVPPRNSNNNSNNINSPEAEDPSRPPPQVVPSDDAVGASWWTLEEIRIAQAHQETVPNLVRVVERAETLYQGGLLPTTHATTRHTLIEK